MPSALSENLNAVADFIQKFVKSYGWQATVAIAVFLWGGYFTVAHPDVFERIVTALINDPAARYAALGCAVLTILALWDRRRFDRMNAMFTVALDRCTDKCDYLDALAISLLNERDEVTVISRAYERRLHLYFLNGEATQEADDHAWAEIERLKDASLVGFVPRISLSPTRNAPGRREIDRSQIPET